MIVSCKRPIDLFLRAYGNSYWNLNWPIRIQRAGKTVLSDVTSCVRCSQLKGHFLKGFVATFFVHKLCRQNWVSVWYSTNPSQREIPKKTKPTKFLYIQVRLVQILDYITFWLPGYQLVWFWLPKCSYAQHVTVMCWVQLKLWGTINVRPLSQGLFFAPPCFSNSRIPRIRVREFQVPMAIRGLRKPPAGSLQGVF